MRVAVVHNIVSLDHYPPDVRVYHEVADPEVMNPVETIIGALERLGHEVIPVEVDRQIWEFLDRLRRLRTDLVFNLCEGVEEHSQLEMNVAALLELLDLPFTGATALTLGLCQRKANTKLILRALGIPTPEFFVALPDSDLQEFDLSFPVIVKPLHEDASLGVTQDSVVSTMKALRQRVAYLHEHYRQGALVEEFIDGRELNVSILGGECPQILPLSEIEFTGSWRGRYRIVSYEAKWAPKSLDYRRTVYRCPVPLGPQLETKVKEVSLSAYRALGSPDYARIDIRVSGEGVPYVLEVNPNPDLAPNSGLAEEALVAGLSYEQLVERILQIALERCHVEDQAFA